MELSAINLSYRQNFDVLDDLEDLFERQKNWVKHDVTHLTYDECKRLSENLTADSRCETAKSILYVVGYMIASLVTIFLTFVMEIAIHSFIVVELDMPNLGIALQYASLAIPFMCICQWLIPIIWKAIYFWEHSAHFAEQEQACTTRMRLLEQQRV